MIEAPLELQKNTTIPQDHLAACKYKGIPTEGNAAGNTKDLLDLTGANVSPKPLPAGYAIFLSSFPSIMGRDAKVIELTYLCDIPDLQQEVLWHWYLVYFRHLWVWLLLRGMEWGSFPRMIELYRFD
jgi:hypothetical protein